MVSDFTNFFFLYSILILMFALVGNFNFIFDLHDEYGGLFESALTVLDTSVGNYDFALFNKITDNETLRVFGNVYVITIVITFNILILNLIIAMLSNTY
jgi:hypothetical protein